MKSNTIVWISAILSVLIICALYVDRNGYLKPSGELISSDTVFDTKVDTVYKTDTFKITNLIPNEVIKLKTDTVYSKDGDEIELRTENKLYQDTLICNKDTAEVRIFTSGINVEVDSLSLKLRKSEEIITNTVTITKYIEKPKKFFDRFHIQPQATFGYDPFNKKFGMVVGVGVGFEL